MSAERETSYRTLSGKPELPLKCTKFHVALSEPLSFFPSLKQGKDMEMALKDLSVL